MSTKDRLKEVKVAQKLRELQAADSGFQPLLVSGTNIKTINGNSLLGSGDLTISGSGGVSDGDKGDITVSASGATWTIDSGVVGTSKLGGDITTAGKNLLDDATAADQRTTLGLGTAAQSATSDFASASHTHTASAITDFNSASRAQTEAELVAGTNITITPASSGATRTLTISASGGSDPWTYVKLGSDFVTSSATAVPVTAFEFTPAASTTYEIEGTFLLRTATATVGPRLGVAWPTGGTDGVAYLQVTSAAGTVVMQNGNINAAVLGPVGGLPNTTQSWPSQLQATLIVGASPTGTFKIQLATETAATNVTMKAGSWFKYRAIP